MDSERYNGRRSARDASPPHRKTTKPPKRGYFENGNWYCDCNPRLPAVSFEVKKESPNKGKWFYTCQQEKEVRCKFFLWKDEAKQREKAAVLSNCHTEPMTPVTERAIKMADYNLEGTESEPEPSPTRRKAVNGIKRSAAFAGLDGVDERDDDYEIQLHDLSHTLSPETPTKELSNSYPSPETTAIKKRKLPWMADELTTPSKKTRMEELMTPSKPIAETPPPVVKTPERPAEAAAVTAPRTSRFTDALADPDDVDSVLANEVLAQLASCAVPVDNIKKIRGILSRYEMKSKGMEKGRDMTRLALEKQKSRNGELETKIRQLENRLSLVKARDTPGKAATLRR